MFSLGETSAIQRLTGVSLRHSSALAPEFLVRPILNFLNTKKLKVEFYAAPRIDFNTERLGAIKAVIIDDSNTTLARGYSVNNKALALIEAFERLWPKLETDSAFEAYHFGSKSYIPVSEEMMGPGSSGSALHSDPMAAAAAASLELIERHVILNAWFLRLLPERVEPTSLGLSARQRLAIESFSLRTFSFPNELGVYVAACVVSCEKSRLFFFGAAAHLSLEEALDKATRECLTIWAFDYLSNRQANGNLAFGGMNQLSIFSQEINFESLSNFFWGDTSASPSTSRVVLKPALARAEISIFLTHKLSSQCYLMRAVSPKLLPLFKGVPNIALKKRFDCLGSTVDFFHPYAV